MAQSLAGSKVPARPKRRKAGRPPDGDSDETRRTLVQAAVHCFAAGGRERTRLREIADASNLTTGTLYHHYATKTILYNEAYLWAVNETFAELEEAILPRPTLEGRLLELLDRIADLTKRRPEIIVLSIQAWADQAQEGTPPLPATPVVTALFDRVVRDAIASGEISPEERKQVLGICRSLIWSVVGVSMTGQRNVAPTLEGLKRLVTGDLGQRGSRRRT